jgi:pyruvyl transferase EpsO
LIHLRPHEFEERLSVLKAKLAEITTVFDKNSRIFYVDYPVHSNIGDQLINLGTEAFFEHYNISIYKRLSVLDLRRTGIPGVAPDSTFLCHGGGNFGDLYGKHQEAREWLMEKYPSCRIVVMPQSLHYSTEAAREASLRRVARHANSYLFVRDHESYSALKQSGIERVAMMPDMAHELWNLLKPNGSAPAGRVLNLLRRDKEAVACAGCEHSVDWKDSFSGATKIAAGGTYYLLSLFGKWSPQRLNARLWYSARNRMVKDGISLFSDYSVVMTNRLHAMLLALLLGREVYASDNTYGKLARYSKAWLAETSLQSGVSD